MVKPLMSTKISVPRLRTKLVARPHLMERLKAGLQCPLTLISAPAGYGKTTLLAALANDIPQSIAWFSLDEEDNERQSPFVRLSDSKFQSMIIFSPL
jgi:LuxR family maltose regulon positive regulatory protein